MAAEDLESVQRLPAAADDVMDMVVHGQVVGEADSQHLDRVHSSDVWQCGWMVGLRLAYNPAGSSGCCIIKPAAACRCSQVLVSTTNYRDAPLLGTYISRLVHAYCTVLSIKPYYFYHGFVSEMTYNVLMGTLNPTHSLTHSTTDRVIM